MSTRYHFSEIHDPQLYTSLGETFEFLHLAHWRLQTANVLHCGAPRVWIMISARQADLLEANLGDALECRFTCSQFLQHQRILVSLAQLEKWNIPYRLEIQNPGELIIVDYGVYYQIYISGPGVAEFVNGCEGDWHPPFTYKTCLRSCDRTKIPIERQELIIGDREVGQTASADQAPGLQGTVDAATRFRSTSRETRVAATSQLHCIDAVERLEMSRDDDSDIAKLSAAVLVALELSEHILPQENDEAKRREILTRYRITRTSDSWLHEDVVNLTLRIMTTPHPRFTTWPSTVFLTNNINWIRDFNNDVKYVLAPRCSNCHWELVYLDLSQHTIVFFGSRSNDFVSWAQKAGSTLDSTVEWDIQYTRPFVVQRNLIDCGFVVLAQADILINPNLRSSIPDRSARLRIRYLTLLIQWARCRGDLTDLSTSLQHYPSRSHMSDNQTLPYFIAPQKFAKDVMATFACPQVFADICSLRQSQLRQRNSQRLSRRTVF